MCCRRCWPRWRCRLPCRRRAAGCHRLSARHCHPPVRWSRPCHCRCPAKHCRPRPAYPPSSSCQRLPWHRRALPTSRWCCCRCWPRWRCRPPCHRSAAGCRRPAARRCHPPVRWSRSCHCRCPARRCRPRPAYPLSSSRQRLPRHRRARPTSRWCCCPCWPGWRCRPPWHRPAAGCRRPWPTDPLHRQR